VKGHGDGQGAQAGGGGLAALLACRDMMLDGADTILTVCTPDGAVVHQNAASVAYAGRRAPLLLPLDATGGRVQEDGLVESGSAVLGVNATQKAAEGAAHRCEGASRATVMVASGYASAPPQDCCADFLAELLVLEPELLVDMAAAFECGRDEWVAVAQVGRIADPVTAG
jgi:hypothetical protein